MKKVVAVFTFSLALLVLSGIFLSSQPVNAAVSTQAPFPNQVDAVNNAASWLIANHQNSDGGYASFSAGADVSPSDPTGTADALLGLAVAGIYPQATLDYIAANSADFVAFAEADGGSAGKLLLGLIAAGENPRDFAGADWVALLVAQLGEDGSMNTATPFGHSLAMLGLAAAGEPVPPAAADWLLARQSSDEGLDGSWEDGFGTLGNSDSTAMAIMALLAAGYDNADDAITRASAFLTNTQSPDGGWEYAVGFGTNANSTAVSLQALSALGIDFFSETSPLATTAGAPLQALLAFQAPTGAFQADFGDGPFDDFYSTVQALPAAAGRSFLVNGRYPAARAAADCLLTLQDPETSGWEQFTTFGVDGGGTARAILALAAIGEETAPYLPALETLTPSYLEFGRGGNIGNVMQAVVAAGGDVTDFAGTDLMMTMNDVISDTGEYDSTQFGTFAHSEAMLGLLTANEPVDPTAVDLLLAAPADGDFGGADTTGIALQVLGKLGTPLPEAVDVLWLSQLPDGGWGFDPANPSSTSEVVQGLIAVGEDPFSPTWSKVISGTLVSPADAIIAQQGDSGCWPNLYGPGEDVFGTVDGVIMLTQKPGEMMPVPVLIDAGVEEEAPAEEEVVEPTMEPEPTEMPEPTPEPEPTAAPEPTPEPEPTEAPVEEIAAAETTAEETAADEGETTAAADDEMAAEEDAHSEEDVGWTNPVLPIILILLALGLAFGVSYYWRNQ